MRNIIKLGFTLSEVLITIGIIGVVAALTIPGLMTKYHRSVAENKIKKFYSIMNQSIRMSIAEHESIVFDWLEIDVDSPNRGDTILEWYKEYIMKYFTGATIEKVPPFYVKATLKDGSGFVSYIFSGSRTLYIFYCLDANAPSCKPESYNGYNTFLFVYNPEVQIFRPAGYYANDVRLKESCYKTENEYRHFCAEIIQRNGWKIPSDYPWIK